MNLSDKLIGRQETTYQVATDNAQDNRDNQQLNQNTATTNMSIDIQKALDIISDVPLFKRTKKDIHETLTRIDNKLIKIGVFGTFSAGKSSLINALLGEQIFSQFSKSYYSSYYRNILWRRELYNAKITIAIIR